MHHRAREEVAGGVAQAVAAAALWRQQLAHGNVDGDVEIDGGCCAVDRVPERFCHPIADGVPEAEAAAPVPGGWRR